MKSLLGMLLGIGLAAAAAAQEIGYVETFSLAADREAALKELVPGTDDYFYYHALHAQNLGQAERFRKVIDDWVRERKGVTTGTARELLNRQALLDYEKDPKKSLDYLRDQLKLTFPHSRKTGERRSDAPTAFDNAHISTDTLLKRALAANRNSLDRIEDAFVSNPVDDGPVYQAAEQKLAEAAANTDVLDQAKVNTERWLSTFLQAAGFSTVEIDWAESPS